MESQKNKNIFIKNITEQNNLLQENIKNINNEADNKLKLLHEDIKKQKNIKDKYDNNLKKLKVKKINK